MQTYLSLDKDSKQLCLFAKKNFEHSSSDVSLKVRGVLNTVTAKTQIDSALNKVRNNYMAFIRKMLSYSCSWEYSIIFMASIYINSLLS